MGRGGSTAVTAILIDGERLVVANVGDSRAVICKQGTAEQLSIDHEPNKERKNIERKGGFVTNLPGLLILNLHMNFLLSAYQSGIFDLPI